MGCSIGSILPDIDSPKSTISKFCRPVAILINHYLGHRGFTHAPIIPTIFLFVLKYKLVHASELSYRLLYGLAAGYFIHLLQDICTAGGVPILYPFSKKKVALFKMKTGDPGNIPASILLLVIWILIIYNRKEIIPGILLYIPETSKNIIKAITESGVYQQASSWINIRQIYSIFRK